MWRTLRIGALALAVALLAACGSTATQPQPTAPVMQEPTTGAMIEEPTTGAMIAEPTAGVMTEQPTEAAMQEMPTEAAVQQPTEVAIAEKPAWQQVAFVDARTGETFTLGDFSGKTVYVEPMATWCQNCRQQLTNIQQIQQQFGDGDYVFVALSVETDLPPEDLAKYADENGFAATFAVASPEALQALVDVFGRTITNPPSTPHFVIRPDGTASELITGIDDSAALTKLLSDGRGG